MGLAAGLGLMVLGTAPITPQLPSSSNVRLVDLEATNVGTRSYPAPSFTPPSLSDGEIEQLIRFLTPAVPPKPTPDHVDFARSFFRELHDIVIDPGKFAADEAVSTTIGTVVEKTIELVRKKKGDAGARADQAKNPIIVVFTDDLHRVVDQLRPTSAGLPVRTTEEIARATGLTLAETEAILKLARFHRSENGTSWILPTGSC
jgi:hypothetical protein